MKTQNDKKSSTSHINNLAEELYAEIGEVVISEYENINGEDNYVTNIENKFVKEEGWETLNQLENKVFNKIDIWPKEFAKNFVEPRNFIRDLVGIFELYAIPLIKLKWFDEKAFNYFKIFSFDGDFKIDYENNEAKNYSTFELKTEFPSEIWKESNEMDNFQKMSKAKEEIIRCFEAKFEEFCKTKEEYYLEFIKDKQQPTMELQNYSKLINNYKNFKPTFSNLDMLEMFLHLCIDVERYGDKNGQIE
ncbi:hypothetical protein [Mycoplasma todarodis]|uniref:Uncharacterized protein n=1 Tax=Mycoplasma todarodis TaxID=1937191 RepID=A0A4R0XJF0_9MOLU|nr:hypothetical protein [Mycoplasma todarodis]TCG10743.1 hypothetical protein C4B25_03105 [Mycoplasma todarodis]